MKMFLMALQSMTKDTTLYKISANPDFSVDDLDTQYLWIYYNMLYYEDKNLRLEQLKKLLPLEAPKEIFKYFINQIYLKLTQPDAINIYAITGEQIQKNIENSDKSLDEYIQSMKNEILLVSKDSTQIMLKSFLFAIARFLVNIINPTIEQKELFIAAFKEVYSLQNRNDIYFSKKIRFLYIYNCDLNFQKGIYDIYYEIFSRFQKEKRIFQINFNTYISSFLLEAFFMVVKGFIATGTKPLTADSINESSEEDSCDSRLSSYLKKQLYEMLEFFKWNQINLLSTYPRLVITKCLPRNYSLSVYAPEKCVDGLILAFLDTNAKVLKIKDQSAVLAQYYNACDTINKLLYSSADKFFKLMSNQGLSCPKNQPIIYRKVNKI